MKALPALAAGALAPMADVLAVAEHGVVANVIEIGALFVVGKHEAHEGDADGRFAGADAVSGGHDRLDEYRFGGGEIADKFLRARLSA